MLFPSWRLQQADLVPLPPSLLSSYPPGFPLGSRRTRLLAGALSSRRGRQGVTHACLTAQFVLWVPAATAHHHPQQPQDSPRSRRSGRAWALCCRSRRKPPCSRSRSRLPPRPQTCGRSTPRRSRPPPRSPSRSGPGLGSCCPQTGHGNRALWSALRPSACPHTLEQREKRDAPSATRGPAPRRAPTPSDPVSLHTLCAGRFSLQSLVFALCQRPGKFHRPLLLVTQSGPTLQPTDCSLSGSSVHGIFQARILEWVALFSSKKKKKNPKNKKSHFTEE